MSEEIKEFFKTYTDFVTQVTSVEIVKKMFLQGKPPSEDNIFHMKRELGDIMWYWVTACASLGIDPYEVICENQEKLAARYGEKFEIERSEVRKEGDL
jgi:NTP pyrophosphatase (non-canonical NTP hydrolase)